MVGFNPDEKQISTGGYAVAGGLSGATTRFITQPLDVLKIRFQLQVEPISSKFSQSKYQGAFHGVRTICREERIGAFWKGHVSAQLLTAVFMSTEFLTYEVLTKLAWHSVPSEYHKISNFGCGAVAGTVGTLVSYPLDLIRTRFIAQGNKQYRSLYGAITQIYSQQGSRGFYTGLRAAIYHAAPLGALNYGCYAIINQSLRPIPLISDELRSGIAGAGAGFTAKFLVYPLDTAKRRLQVMEFSEARKNLGKTHIYRNVVDYIMRSVKEEGIHGPFKGMSWALVKASTTTSLYFYFYAVFCSTLRGRTSLDEDDSGFVP